MRLADSGYSDESIDSAALSVIREELSPLDGQGIDTVVLGCTHFVYFKESFKKYLPDGCPIFNGISGTANHVVRTLSLGEMGERLVGGEGAKETLGRTEFYISGERADRETMEKIENCISLLFDVRE